MYHSVRCAVPVVMGILALAAACSPEPTGLQENVAGTAAAASLAAQRSQPFPVSGSSIIYVATEIVHSEEPTADGLIRMSSVAGQLSGDLNGSLLFHPTAVFDFTNGTLVNTGTQFFTGTIGGSEPVVLHDDRFRFDIDLNTFETVGSVHLSRSKDAPHPGAWFECDLATVGTGLDADGNITSDYTGTCVARGS